MKWLPLFAACVVSSFLVCGCGRKDITVSHARIAPVLSDVSLAPQQFTYGGGTSTLQVNATSDRGIRAVTAAVTPWDQPAASPRIYPLTFIGGTAYQTQISVPSNTAASGQAMLYRVSVVAEDADGVQSVASVLQIRVDAADAPPGTPE